MSTKYLRERLNSALKDSLHFFEIFFKELSRFEHFKIKREFGVDNFPSVDKSTKFKISFFACLR